jgi:S-DNA-T family DNA segregation ATPase FtsK/SpoIIIE
VPVRPGHGLAPDGAHTLTALPQLAGIDDATAAVAAAWPGKRAPAVRLLPDRLEYAELAAMAGPPEGGRRGELLPIGVDETGLEPVYLDFRAEPHLLCFADGESGKTALLRLIARGLADRLPPERARIVLIDYRRTLLGAISPAHLIGYASTAQAAAAAITEVAESLRGRLPGPDVTPGQLRARAWWHGPDVYVLVDDYDLVAPTVGGATANPLHPLLEFLPQAKDVGLHLVLARRSGGAGRALFEPVIARLRELASPAWIGSGSPDEGALVDAVKPTPQPPGRGSLVNRRSGVRRLQLAWLGPAPDADGEPG